MRRRRVLRSMGGLVAAAALRPVNAALANGVFAHADETDAVIERVNAIESLTSVSELVAPLA